MRTCSTCKQTKPLDAFYKKNVTQYRSDCKDCHKAVIRPRSRAHYRANKGYYRKRNQKRTAAITAFVRQYKINNPTCTDCQLDHPWWRLDFDHLEGFKKDGEVSRARSLKWSNERILREIAKCELVCANCHRDRTHTRRIGQESNLPG